jgi:hypothetical protein
MSLHLVPFIHWRPRQRTFCAVYKISKYSFKCYSSRLATRKVYYFNPQSFLMDAHVRNSTETKENVLVGSCVKLSFFFLPVLKWKWSLCLNIIIYSSVNHCLSHGFVGFYRRYKTHWIKALSFLRQYGTNRYSSTQYYMCAYKTLQMWLLL